MKLREQRGLNAIRGLVARPKLISERLDYVIRCHAYMRSTTLDHLQHCDQYADDRAKRLVFTVVESTLAIEVTNSS